MRLTHTRTQIPNKYNIRLTKHTARCRSSLKIRADTFCTVGTLKQFLARTDDDGYEDEHSTNVCFDRIRGRLLLRDNGALRPRFDDQKMWGTS